MAQEGDRGDRASARREHHEPHADLTQQSAASRIAAANARDAVAHARDLAAKARDRAADLRDREHGVRGEPVANDDRAVTGAEILLRAAKYRSDAAADRAAAAEIRANSAADRDEAAHDREQAARDRLQAALDRDALLQQARDANAASLNDRPASSSGLVDLDHAIDRAHRATGLLVVAHIGVLKRTTASGFNGGSSGEEHLGRVVRAIRRHLRGSDLIVRLDSDELLCVMFGATAQNASARFGSVRAELEAQPDPPRISVGITALAPGDSLDELVRSANATD
jgi:GGDEF domain-containing protein